MTAAMSAAAIASEWASAIEVYATVVAGDCMAPLVVRGACIAVDPIVHPIPGDLVVLVKKPTLIRDGEPPAVLKRLVGALDRSRIPYKPTSPDDLEPCVMVEMLNPRRRMAVPHSALAAVHFCVGVVPESRGSARVDWDRVAQARARGFGPELVREPERKRRAPAARGLVDNPDKERRARRALP